jgi:hypothetical protein
MTTVPAAYIVVVIIFPKSISYILWRCGAAGHECADRKYSPDYNPPITLIKSLAASIASARAFL